MPGDAALSDQMPLERPEQSAELRRQVLSPGGRNLPGS
jgi:pyrroline-5-carboxylate reductase